MTCNSNQICSEFMNDFEFKRQQKTERFRELAEKHESISTGRHLAAREQLQMIPPGQPILVGHHSEKRHRGHYYFGRDEAEERLVLDQTVSGG
jgi:Domain of unknown function (DUF3560)